ncbi:hypothetical protein HWI79_672 [Cryptosporidium felis]|nr:hypothetical protein HWI79_672 [Cryptosporidium felis]
MLQWRDLTRRISLASVIYFRLLWTGLTADTEYFGPVVPDTHSRAIFDVIKSNNEGQRVVSRDVNIGFGELAEVERGRETRNGIPGQPSGNQIISRENPETLYYGYQTGDYVSGNVNMQTLNTYGSKDLNFNRDNTYHVVYTSNQKNKMVPLYLSGSPIVIKSNGLGNSVPNSEKRLQYTNRQEINRNFSPYSSIHYLTSDTTRVSENPRWKWDHIDKPILRTNTPKPIEFKHKIPTINEAWWNSSNNIRKESKKVAGPELDSGDQNGPSLSNSQASLEDLASATSVKEEKHQDNQLNLTQYHTHDSHKHSHGHKHGHHKRQSKQEAQNHSQSHIQNQTQQDELLRSATVGDVVNLTRLEVPNPYERKAAIDKLISTSLENLKQENWSIPVEELINATFIYPGTQQPDLVPNQIGPKVKPRDFYCNPGIHKCTTLYEVGTAIGEPIWKIYNTSTIGRAQRRVSNLLDDTEVGLIRQLKGPVPSPVNRPSYRRPSSLITTQEHLTMGLTQTFIDYIEQEPTIEFLESMAKAPSNIFQIPENGSINQFYDNTTKLGVFQSAEFISPQPQNVSFRASAKAQFRIISFHIIYLSPTPRKPTKNSLAF